MTSTESIPQVWDDERDGAFFRISAQIFPCEFCYGAGVLLASYDVDDAQLGTAIDTPPLVHREAIAPAMRTATTTGPAA